MKARWVLWAFLCIAVSVGFGCGSDEGGDGGALSDSDEPIVLGQAKGFTGFMQSFDQPPATAAEMAVEDINQDGGLSGRDLEVVTADTRSKVEEGRRAALEVIEDGADFIQATGDFDLGAPLAQEAQKNGVVAMSDVAGSVQFGPAGIGPLAFTMGTPGITEGLGVWEWGSAELDLSNPFILEDPSLEYYKQIVAGFEQGVERTGGTIAGHDTYESTDPSIAPTVQRIKESGADSMLLTGLPSAGASAIKQIRAAGIDIPILAPNTYDGEAWKESVPDVSDMYFTTYASIYGDDPRPFVNEFVERYVDETGEEPENSNLVVGYAVVEAFKSAAEECDCLDGEGLASAIEAFDGEEFAGGSVVATFTDELHATLDRPLTIMEIQDGKSSYVDTYELSAPPELEL